MQRWAALATKTVEIEFPSWETFQAFSVFGSLDDDQFHVRDDHVARLAVSGSVPAAQLKSEILDHRTMARERYKCCRDTRVAWKESVQCSQRTGHMRRAHPCAALRPVAKQMCGWGASSSGVEQIFGKQSHLLGRMGFYRSHLNDHLTLIDSRMELSDELITLAQHQWRDVYSHARVSGKSRITHFSKGATTIIKWVSGS